MAQTWDDSLDSPSAYDQCPSFAGGQLSYARPRQLQPDQAALLQDVEVAITGAAISRRGTLQLGGDVGTSSAIRALAFYKTPAFSRPMAISNNGTYYLSGATWTNAAKTVSTSHDINFAQGFSTISAANGKNRLFLADGVDLFQWDGTTWTTISSVGSNATAPRGATLALWFTNRLIVGGADIKNEAADNVPDAIYLSNFLSADVWDDVAHSGSATKDGAQIRVGAGDGAANVALVPWQNYNIAVFKRHSVYVVVADPTLAIADMPVQLVHSTVGCVASRTACQVGADIFFLSDDGVRSLEATAGSDQQHETGLPLSYPVQDVINRINWQYANTACATFWRNLYLISLPLDSSTTPNYILTYNVLTSKWNGTWTNIPALCFAQREDNNITKLMIGLATDNLVVDYLDYVSEANADDDTYTDYNDNIVLPQIVTRSMYFNDPISPKLGIGSEFEWFNSKGTAVITVIEDEIPKAFLSFSLGAATTGFSIPFDIPFDLSFSGLARRGHDLMRYGEFRELQYQISTLCAGRKEIRQITSNAIVNPSLIGFSDETTLATGACCLGPACVITTRCACEDAGGTYMGDGTVCAGLNCGQYYSPITILKAKVPSTQTDFPVLVDQTDDRFKTVANGGHVGNANGYDIRPYADTGKTTAMDYELESYDGTTGRIRMWVKVGSVSSASNTTFYLFYGDATIVIDGSSTAAWSNSFLGVYHFGDGVTLNVNSATGSNNATNNGATATTGQIYGGASLAAGSNQFLEITNTLAHNAVTYSAWVNGASFPAAFQAILSKDGGSAVSEYFVKSNGKIMASVTGTGGGVNYDGTGATTLQVDTWYHVVLTYDITNGLNVYVNTALDKNVAGNGQVLAGVATTGIGKDIGAAGRYWDGKIDEARVASVARSANWITTEYNNQFDIPTFEILGTEVIYF